MHLKLCNWEKFFIIKKLQQQKGKNWGQFESIWKSRYDKLKMPLR